MSISEKELLDLPKVELHRHLDGSVRLETVREEAIRHGIDLPGLNNGDEFKKAIQVLSPMKDLSEVLNVFWNTQSVFKDMKTFERIAYEGVEDAYNEGIRLVEFRYSPGFCSSNHGHKYEDVLHAFEAGIEKAKEKYDIGVGLIAIISRTLGMEEAEKTAQFVIDQKKSFVGFDLADEEVGFEPRDFQPMFQDIKDNGIHITVHSGEEGDPQNVLNSIENLYAERIGHGVQLHRSKDLRDEVKNLGVTLELCPSSNWLTRAVDSLESHPLKLFFNEGMKVSINTDDPGIMALTLQGEYKICAEKLGFTIENFKKANEMALEASFLPEQEKIALKSKYF